MNTSLKQTDKIKLLIFDLDETFWTGTLSSEKPILPIKYNIELVKTLVDRGIMCSISSKNDFEKAKETLQSMGVWDLFIFPSINWNSKGAQIKQLIQNAQLRDENVLFVDDNHLNLEEAKFHCPNIKTAFPNILTEILDFEGFKGKDDRKHSRLNQYKILEQKHIEKSTFNSNQEFLESSNIQVECKSINSNDIDRIIELILRTNQLNFTKKRIDKNTLSSILNNPNYESKCIFVKDRFGDYGLVGFYCLDKPNSELIHFIFSCRIMNLGVEQYIYAKLKFPKLNIIQPVSSTLDNKSCPSYINKKFKKVKQKTSKKALKVLLLGNCDIQALSHYAMSIYNQIKVLFYIDISKETHMQIRYDSIWKMKNAVNLLNEEKSYLIKMHKWLDKTSFDNRAIYDDYDVLVFSVLNDYMVKTYKDVKTGITLTTNTSYEIDIFSSKIEDVENAFKKHGVINFSREDIIKYQKNLIEQDYMSEKEFEDNLNWLVEHVKKPIIFINGAEIKHPNDTKNYQTRFIKYNKILDKFVAEHKNCYLIDMRKYVTSIENTTDRLTHYQREIYMQMAKEMFNIISSISNITINPNYHKMVVLIKNIKSIFKTIMQKTFSVINDYRFSAKYKVITILGIKIRIKIKNL